MFAGFWQHTRTNAHSVNGFHLATTPVSQLQLSVFNRGVGGGWWVDASVLEPSVLPSQRDLICCVLALDNTRGLSRADADPRTLTWHHPSFLRQMTIKQRQEFEWLNPVLKWPGATLGVQRVLSFHGWVYFRRQRTTLCCRGRAQLLNKAEVSHRI